MPESLQGRLPTLDEHNRQKIMERKALQVNGAGVACPKCGMEMVLAHPGQINLSFPPSEIVRCPSCGRTGEKY